MSLYGVQNVLFRLKKDKGFVERFKLDAQAALASHDLTETERAALAGGDLAALYLMGAHPLLMAPYSRLMGISRVSYQQQLMPHKGVRTMRS